MNAFVQWNIFISKGYGLPEFCIPIEARDDHDAGYLASQLSEACAVGTTLTLCRSTLSFPDGKRALLVERIFTVTCGEPPF